MSGKIDVILLQGVKWLWQKNDVVAVSVAYAKNVLFPKGQAKQADAWIKNTLAQKKEQEKKHVSAVGDTISTIELYIQAWEPLIIKRKVTPSWSLYEKVHETDVRSALSQRKVSLPSDVVVTKQVRDTTGTHKATLQRWNKKIMLPFTIKESLY